jgi:hypothetical protein
MWMADCTQLPSRAIIHAMSKPKKHQTPPTQTEPPKDPMQPWTEDEPTATTKKPGGPPDTGDGGDEG